MFCMNCGTQLPDGSRFCSQCGTPQVVAPAAAPAAQQPVYPQQPAYQQPVYPQQPAYQQPNVQPAGYAPQQTGALLLEAGKVTRYNGGKAIGTVTGDGDFFVYDNRIEYHKKTGNQSGYMLGPVLGAALSINDAKKNPIDTYWFQEIASVRKGKYAGLKETVVLEMKNGKAVSFVPSTKKANPDQICSLIAPYLR